VPLYESNADAVKSEVATIFKVFPEGNIWGNDVDGSGYDVVLLGHVDPLTIDVDQLQARLDRSDHARVKHSLAEVGFDTVLGLVSTFTVQASDLKPWLEDAEINRDRNLRLQYLAGMGLNSYKEGLIYDQMLAHRVFPERLFAGSDKTLAELKRRLGPVPAKQ
jgi:spermidine synthase